MWIALFKPSLRFDETLSSLSGIPVGFPVQASAETEKALHKKNYTPEVLLQMLEEIVSTPEFKTFCQQADHNIFFENLPKALYYFQIGHRFLKNSIFNAAGDALEKGLELYPYFVPARLQLVQTKLKFSQAHAALTIIHDGLKITPQQMMLKTQLALIELHLGNVRRAQSTFSPAVSAYAQDAKTPIESKIAPVLVPKVGLAFSR